MNLTTHILFGLVVGAVFFGKPEVMLLLGVGAAIPDLDREYGFLSEDSFRKHQVHRAVFHNFLFLGLLYLINPFLGLGAFLHTLLDAVTTAKDRGVEWLYPFTRFAKKSLHDSQGKDLPLDSKTRVYFYQDDPVELTRKSDEDLKEYKPAPWRRTYGPALSGAAFDFGIFVGSIVIVIVLAILSLIGVRQFIDLNTLFSFSFNLHIPLFIGMSGIALELGMGEIDRRIIKEEKGKKQPSKLYRAFFLLSASLMVLSVILGAYLNQDLSTTFIYNLPYIVLGVVTVILVGALVLELYFSKRVSSYLLQFRKMTEERKTPEDEKHTEDKENIAVI